MPVDMSHDLVISIVIFSSYTALVLKVWHWTSKKISTLEEFNRTTLVELVKESTSSNEKVAKMMDSWKVRSDIQQGNINSLVEVLKSYDPEKIVKDIIRVIERREE